MLKGSISPAQTNTERVTWDRRVFPIFIFIGLGLRPEKLAKKETGEIKEKERESGEAGFSIEGGTQRLIAAYFGIYSRLLCV